MNFVKNILRLSLVPVLLTSFILPAYANAPANGFPPILESKAYQKYKRRPVSDLSRLIYLIERFEPSGAEIYYDGIYFKAPFAAWMAKAFLFRNYKKETVEEWVMKWCNTSIGGNMIYAKFPDGKYLRARDVLMDEMKALESL